MNQAETEKFLSLMWATFPNAKKAGDSESDVQTMVWQRIFADISFEIMAEVFFDKIAVRHTFMPTPAEVKAAVNEYMNPDIAEIDGETSFAGVLKAIDTTSYTAIMVNGVLTESDYVLRGKMTPLEWEVFQSMGGSRRFRMATPGEIPFLRNDYKQSLKILQARALSGAWEPKHDYITLQEMNQAALEAEARDSEVNTKTFRDYLRRFNGGGRISS